MALQLTAAITVIVALMLLLLRQRVSPEDNGSALRPLTGYKALKGQVGRAIESGSQLHVTLGRTSLVGPATATSVAAVQVLDALAKDGCANSTPPLITTGDGTLLPAAQDSLRHAYEKANRASQYRPYQAVFVASRTDPYAYAAGVSLELARQDVISNVLVGRLGPELILMTEAANRRRVAQVVGSDDPVALAVATAATGNVLIGEEMLVAGAYLQGRRSQLASVQLQDILRWIVALAVLGVAVYQFVVG